MAKFSIATLSNEAIAKCSEEGQGRGRLQFTNGNTTNYVYNAAGQKLSVTHLTAIAGVVIPMTSVMTPLAPAQISTTFKTDYCGNVIYENGAVSRILTEEGYITLSGTTPTYHYYLQDHQGNNRVVINQSGTVEQVNHYYPFGGLMGESTAGGVQPYKYNGKELDRMHGLDLFDYGARHYDAAIGRWMTVDRFAEKYMNLSPYQYAGNNPINNIDINGDSISVNQSIYNNFVLNRAFGLFVNDKNGLNFLADYASKGQTLYDHTFSKDGKYHKAGINLEYTTYKGSEREHGYTRANENGTITVGINSLSSMRSADNRTYNWGKEYIYSSESANQMTYGILGRTLTFFHESFIHVDLFAKDFIDNRSFDYSNIPSYIKNYANDNGIPKNQLHHINVLYNNMNNLWPGSAYNSMKNINQSFGQRYTATQILKMLWNYEGGK